MTTFHRLTVPTYYGGLPGGYDYINNAISGTPAAADGAKVGGPNAGTYFVAFGEDATSADINRPNSALAQNTDHLDDLMHRDIASLTRTADVTPGSPVASVTITGPGIFVGGIGDTLLDLFHVTDANDDDIDVSGTKIVVSSIGPDALGAGFSVGNLTVTFNVSIPTGQTYRIYYGQRANLATLPADAFMNMRVRGAVAVDAQVEELFRQLHGNGEAWNAAWDNTIYGLNQGVIANAADITTIKSQLAALHGNAEAWNAPWDNTIYTLDQAVSTIETLLVSLHGNGASWPLSSWNNTVYDMNLAQMELPPLNFGSAVSTAALNIKRGYFYAVDQQWFAVGDGGNDYLVTSPDFGKSWISLVGLLGASLPLIDVSAQTTGNVLSILCSGTRTVYSGARSAYHTYTFASHVNAVSHSVSDGRLAWENTAALFIAAYRSGASGIYVDTSPDSVTWTARAVPAAWSGYTGTAATPQMKAIPGRVIAAFLDDTAAPTAKINIMYSTNGGVGWTNVQVNLDVAMSGATSHVAHPTYDRSTGYWYVLVYDTMAQVSMILRSTDGGVSWSNLVTTPTITGYLTSIAALPGCRVFLSNDHRVIVTSDDTHYYLVGQNVETNTVILDLREGGGGLMVWNPADKTSWASSRLGNNSSSWGVII